MIVAFTLPAMAHVKPMMPLLSGLVHKRHEVVCYGHRKFEDTIRASGATFAPYPDIAYDVEAPNFNLVRMAADLIDAAETIHTRLLPEIAAMSPRLILQDFMAPWASRIGTALIVPRIHTIATVVFNTATQRLMRREEGIVKLAGDVVSGMPHLLRAMIRSRFALTVREAYGLERSWGRISPPRCELVFSIEELQAGDPRGDVPRHYIGPAFDAGEGFQPPGLRKYALITFGTLSNNDTRRFEAAMRGAFLAGYSAVAVCGRKVDLRYLGGVAHSLEEAHPSRTAMVVDRVPELEPWLLGADVVIHHAGTATTWESIRFRKPALFIPINADQKVHASLLEQQALGVRLASGHEVEPEAIARGLESVRKIAYSGERFHRRMAQAGGAAAGVDIIVRTLETQA